MGTRPSSSSLFVASVSYAVTGIATFLLKVHDKVIKILAVRWHGTRLMHIFKETTTSDESWVVSWEQQSYGFPHKLNILLDGLEGLRTRLEYRIPLLYFALFAKICAAQHGLYTLEICFLRLWHGTYVKFFHKEVAFTVLQLTGN